MTITFSRATKIFILSAVFYEVILIYNAMLWESASESATWLAKCFCMIILCTVPIVHGGFVRLRTSWISSRHLNSLCCLSASLCHDAQSDSLWGSVVNRVWEADAGAVRSAMMWLRHCPAGSLPTVALVDILGLPVPVKFRAALHICMYVQG